METVLNVSTTVSVSLVCVAKNGQRTLKTRLSSGSSGPLVGSGNRVPLPHTSTTHSSVHDEHRQLRTSSPSPSCYSYYLCCSRERLIPVIVISYEYDHRVQGRIVFCSHRISFFDSVEVRSGTSTNHLLYIIAPRTPFYPWPSERPQDG